MEYKEALEVCNCVYRIEQLDNLLEEINHKDVFIDLIECGLENVHKDLINIINKYIDEEKKKLARF